MTAPVPPQDAEATPLVEALAKRLGCPNDGGVLWSLLTEREKVLYREQALRYLAPLLARCAAAEAKGDTAKVDATAAHANADENYRRLVEVTAERDRLRDALTEIAKASPEPDDKNWYDNWNDPASYLWLGADGVVYESSVDISNRGDNESFGYERGLHASAVIARKALTPADGGSDGTA